MITQNKSKKKYYKFRSNYQVIVLTLFFVLIKIKIFISFDNYKRLLKDLVLIH